MKVLDRSRYLQRAHRLPVDVDALPPSTANVCVFPTGAEVEALAAQLRGLHVISIGCGEGYFEALLQRAGLDVKAVDLRSSSGDEASEAARWASSNCFCGEIVRVRPHELFRLPDKGRGCALLFVFGKRCPLHRYLAAFPGCHVVAIAGTNDGVTSPSYDALAQNTKRPERGAALELAHDWKTTLDIPVRAVTSGARIVCYRRQPAVCPMRGKAPHSPSPLRSRFWVAQPGEEGSSEDESSSIDTDDSGSELAVAPEPEPEPEPVQSPRQLAAEAAWMGCLADIWSLLDPQRRLRGVAVRTPHTLCLRSAGLTPMHITVLLDHLCDEVSQPTGKWIGRLREIDLSDNQGLGDGAVSELAATLHRCCPLLFSLDIRGVSVRTRGALSWSRALKAGRYADLSFLWLEEHDSALRGARRRTGVHPSGWSGNAVSDTNVLRSLNQLVSANRQRHIFTPTCAAQQRASWARCACLRCISFVVPGFVWACFCWFCEDTMLLSLILLDDFALAVWPAHHSPTTFSKASDVC